MYNKARKLAIEKDGVLWVCTPQGVSSFVGTKWTSYTTENSGLAANLVTALAIDKENRKWFGIFRQRLVCFDGKSWETYTTENGLPDNMIHCITFTGDGNMWIGTDKGVSCFDGKTWMTYNEENSGISSNHVFAIEAHSATMWFGTYSGVSSYDGVSRKVYSAQTDHDILEDRCVYTIDFDNEGKLWCGTTTGMWSYDGNSWIGYSTQNSGLKDDFYIRAILVDSKKTRWIGSRGALMSLSGEIRTVTKKTAVPAQMTITGNFPNPFNPSTTLEYTLPKGGFVTIDVYTISGQKVLRLMAENVAPGTHTVVWNGTDDQGLYVASGVYIFRLEMGKTILSHRMLLVR